jgi:hypothetical protein
MKLTSIKEEVAMSGMMKPGTHTSFSPLKQIEAGVLNVGYAEEGLVDDRHFLARRTATPLTKRSMELASPVTYL